MSRPIHFVLNPNARRLARDPGLMRRIEALSRGRARVWVTRNLDELGEAARQLALERPDLVVLCGGDGTFMSGVTALQMAYADDRLPRLAFAPAGTVATVARNWGTSAGVLAVVEHVLGRAPLRSRERPTLWVREQSGAFRVGFTVGTGLVARFFDRYYAAGGGGTRTALAIVARIFTGSLVGDGYARSVLEPLPCVLTVDGRELEPRAFSLVVSSVLPDLGLHMRVTYRAGADFERPHLVASALRTKQLGPQAPRVLRGLPLRGPDCFDSLVTSFSVTFPKNEPGPYVLDGDVFRASSIQVSAGPKIDVVTLEP
ncbi:MAG TPA: diacylglycerol kinase family protein [Polyangiaceae bacterium]|nr:diacylglycerol kinase family protein [Polyangiaceae bacterium]